MYILKIKFEWDNLRVSNYSGGLCLESTDVSRWSVVYDDFEVVVFSIDLVTEDIFDTYIIEPEIVNNLLLYQKEIEPNKEKHTIEKVIANIISFKRLKENAIKYINEYRKEIGIANILTLGVFAYYDGSGLIEPIIVVDLPDDINEDLTDDQQDYLLAIAEDFKDDAIKKTRTIYVLTEDSDTIEDTGIYEKDVDGYDITDGYVYYDEVSDTDDIYFETNMYIIKYTSANNIMFVKL